MRFDLPHWLAPPVSRIGAASIALGLMCAGVGMQLGLLTHAKRLTAGVLAARMGYNGPYIAGVVSLPFALSLMPWRLSKRQPLTIKKYSCLPFK
ncbi:MAG: hypothetical protein ITG01_01755 [Comamonas sp.]|nr:hypothetical protein [Comamonas sp.]